MFLLWNLGDMTSFESSIWPAILVVAYVCQLITFSYCWSFIFTTNKNSIATLTSMGLRLAFVPIVTVSTGLFLYSFLIPLGFKAAAPVVLGRMYVWGVSIFSPQYGFLLGLLNLLHVTNLPIFAFPVAASVMLGESLLYFLYARHLDSLSYSREERRTEESAQAVQQLRELHPDVAVERTQTRDICSDMLQNQSSSDHTYSPASVESPSFSSQAAINSNVQWGGLLMHDLRKVYPPPRVLNMYTLLSAFYKRFSSQQSANDSADPGQQQTKPVIAVEGVSFHVKKGEIFGLLGANGAGKSTTISMVTRDVLPTAGEAFLAGISILGRFREAAQQLGVVYQTNALWENLTVHEHLKLMAQLRGVHESRLVELTQLVISKLQLIPHQDKLTKDLSGGMKRKLCVAIALIGNPSIILLDEPCAGLDPLSRRNLRALITACMSNRAVVLTTHSMDEADALCHKIAIMAKGQIRAIGSRQHLKEMFGQHYEVVVKLKRRERVVHDESLTVLPDDDMDDAARSMAVEQYLTSRFPSARLIRSNGGLLVFHIPQRDVMISTFFDYMEAAVTRLRIDHYSLDQPSLEQVFLHTVAPYADQASNQVTSNSGSGNTNTSNEADHTFESVSTLDLYYSGRFNSFGCTRPSLRQISLALSASLVALVALFLLSSDQAFIWFMFAFLNVLLLLLCLAIVVWTDRTKLLDFLFFNGAS